MNDFKSPLETNDISPPTGANNFGLNMVEERKGILLFGITGGALAAIVGAVIWALITVSTGYRIGWMAIGVGFLVGIGIRFFGRENHVAFGILGALFAFLGCLLGNIFSIYGLFSKELNMGILDVVGKIGFGLTIDLLIESFQAIDLLFYGLAIYEGYKFAVLRRG